MRLVGAGSNTWLNEELLLLDLVTTARKPLIPMLSGIMECIVVVLSQPFTTAIYLTLIIEKSKTI